MGCQASVQLVIFPSNSDPSLSATHLSLTPLFDNSPSPSLPLSPAPQVADQYKLVPDTLYLSCSFIDRYLSQHRVTRSRLQLLGVTSMLIAR